MYWLSKFTTTVQHINMLEQNLLSVYTWDTDINDNPIITMTCLTNSYSQTLDYNQLHIKVRKAKLVKFINRDFNRCIISIISWYKLGMLKSIHKIYLSKWYSVEKLSIFKKNGGLICTKYMIDGQQIMKLRPI